MISKIHLWLPSFASGKGGIQVFSDYLLQALEQVAKDAQISVLIKNDVRAELSSLPARKNSTRLVTCGDLNGGLRTASFSAKAFSMALRERPDLIITAPANFAPLAHWINRLLKIPYWTVCHGIEVWDLKQPSRIEALRRSQRLLCVSQYTRQRVADALSEGRRAKGQEGALRKEVRAKGEGQIAKSEERRAKGEEGVAESQEQGAEGEGRRMGGAGASSFAPSSMPSALGPMPFAHLDWFPNTVRTEHFAIKPKPRYLLERYGWDEATPVLFTLARMAAVEGYKGYDTVIKALPKIRAAIPNVRYILAGKGDDRGRIEKLVRDLHLEQNVVFAGFLPDDEVADHYSLCDLFAMPSKGEGFGIVFLEAMACGKPVLAGNKDGSVDAVNNGELGALVDPDDIDAVATATIEILERCYPNPLMFQPEALRQRVEEIYGFAQFKGRLEQLLGAQRAKGEAVRAKSKGVSAKE